MPPLWVSYLYVGLLIAFDKEIFRKKNKHIAFGFYSYPYEF